MLLVLLVEAATAATNASVKPRFPVPLEPSITADKVLTSGVCNHCMASIDVFAEE